MAQTLSRQVLYDLVWSTPLKQLCERFGISDVALKKTCAKADIPTPERGYWARKEAGKKVQQIALPPRAPGMDDDVVVGGGIYGRHSTWTNEELLGPMPLVPEFSEALESVRERAVKAIGKVVVPRELRVVHPAIDRLLRADEQRRQKQLETGSSFSWNSPLFETPAERRRLRILNVLFLAVAKSMGKPEIRGREAREIIISFHQQHVLISLDLASKGYSRHRQATVPRDAGDSKLCLAIMDGWGSEKMRSSWIDDDAGTLESKMTEIAIEMVVVAEIQHREAAVRMHGWRAERKAEFEEAARRRKLEAERAERERLKRLEQARIDRLLKDAAALKLATDIRNYVEAARQAASERGVVSDDALNRWREWALVQADRIDPVYNMSFVESLDDTSIKVERTQDENVSNST